ncbi:MAG: porin [Burkholderiales bacterium]|nr:porin [Burkholderiales bacterium]
MKTRVLAVCIAAAYTYAGFASAQTAPAAPAAPAAPSLGAVLAATPGLSITGYVASTYTHFDTTPALRAFDTSQNGFKLNQAAVTLAYLPTSGAGAQVTAIAGSDAKILRNGECYQNGSVNCGSGGQFDLNNAFVQYATGPLTVMAGKFSTLAGAEVVNPAADNEISRSLLFWDMEPGTHTGVRAAYAVSGALTLTAGVNNGWNFTSAPAGTAKTIELGASGSPNKMFSYSGAFYSGQSPLYGGSPNGTLQLLDLVGTLNATDALNFVANVDILSKDDYLGAGTGKGKANGLALYANYSLTDQWMLSARGEYIDDKDGIVSGINGTSNKLKELTLAVNYAPVKNLKLSVEARQDKSDVAIFTKNGASTNNQTSLELQGIYSF